ncbi:MAG TPA: response regulator [Methanocella sp.]|jgi:two-component system chemotaxis response regulator CheY
MENNSGPQACSPATPGQASVGIIEDNVEIVELYLMLVKSLGMRVSFVAYDGDAGVKAFMAADSRPDVVLIDHRMPIKNGLAAMKEMLALQPTIRFVFISADVDMKKEAMAAGARVFLSKPSGIKEITDALNEALAHDS